MPTMTGADPDLLDELANELTASAERLRGLQAQLGVRVRDCPWQGQDAERVRSEWVSRHDQAISRLATDLGDASEVARRNAAEQRQASAADGPSGLGLGGAAGAGAGAGAGPGLGAAVGAAVGGGGGGSGEAPVDGPDLSVSGEGSVTAGDLTAEGSFDAGIRPKFEVDAPEFEVSGAAFDKEITDEEGKLVLAEAGVSTGVSASIADAHAEGTADLGIVHAEGEADATVGASAEGEAGLKLTEEGLVAAAGVSAMAGVSAEAKGSIEAAGVTAEAGAHATAGLEFKAEAEAEFSADKVGVQLELSAALGIGGGVSLDISVDPAEAAEEIGDLLDEL